MAPLQKVTQRTGHHLEKCFEPGPLTEAPPHHCPCKVLVASRSGPPFTVHVDTLCALRGRQVKYSLESQGQGLEGHTKQLGPHLNKREQSNHRGRFGAEYRPLDFRESAKKP